MRALDRLTELHLVNTSSTRLRAEVPASHGIGERDLAGLVDEG
jgi:hypothetical protein